MLVNSKTIEAAVYKMCLEANLKLPKSVYERILKVYEDENTGEYKNILKNILKNAFIANKTQRPLCQDTGQVLVFLKLGQNVTIEGKNINIAINDAIKKCYKQNFFRKSIVKNALFNRENTLDNTPALIYTDIIDGDEIKIDILIKGGGAENMSVVKMFEPSASDKEIIDFIYDVVEKSGTNACPPLFLGVGIGGTMDWACVLSKKAFFNKNDADIAFAQEIKNAVGAKVLDVSVLSSSTHIASLPVAITLNCHSNRHASCKISSDKIEYDFEDYEPVNIFDEDNFETPEIFTHEVEKIRSLKSGQNILLTGEVYTARDAAHKRLIELMEKGEKLPFELKDSIIFYTGPCPKKDGETSSPTGPTTSSRMDRYSPVLYEKGLMATIGKGERSLAVEKSIKENHGIYFTLTGGIASLIAQKIKKSVNIAFEDLQSEAIVKFYIEKLPLKVEISG